MLMFLGTKIGIRLHKNREELLLLVDPKHQEHMNKGYKIILHSLQLEALRLKLAPETILVLENQLANSAARYYIPRT